MTYRPVGPTEVRPNTLQDQAIPNTFRSKGGPMTVDQPRINSGGGNAGPARLGVRPQLRLWVYLAIGLLVVIVAVFVLNATP